MRRLVDEGRRFVAEERSHLEEAAQRARRQAQQRYDPEGDEVRVHALLDRELWTWTDQQLWLMVEGGGIEDLSHSQLATLCKVNMPGRVVRAKKCERQADARSCAFGA